MSLVATGIFSFRFIMYFDTSTTQDFANFGAYFGGVLTPIATFASAVFIGIQIVENTKNIKIERIVKESREYVVYLQNLLENIDDAEVKVSKRKAKTAFDNGDNPFLACSEFYRKNTKVFETFSLIYYSLNQLKLLDIEQYMTMRTFVQSRVYRDKLIGIEQLHFYLMFSSNKSNHADYKYHFKNTSHGINKNL